MATIDFGTTTIDGITYTLTSQADYTGRLLSGTNFHEADAGESYVFEMAATATSPDGIDGKVAWIFEAIKGEEPELDTYDYSEAYRFIEC